MDLLRGFTKRAPSPPGSAAVATGGSSPTEECTPGDRLFQLSQDIFFEEERHQQAMMALESSVLGCGSDDWSVDSDYAFQDFADDVKQHRHNNSVEPPQQSSPERSPPLPGTPNSIYAVCNPINDLNTGMTHKVREHPDTAAETVVPTTSPAEGGGANGGEAPSPGKGVSAGGENREESPTESGRDDPCMSEARLFGDPGSSTDSAHILRLEQRMFLKAAFQLLEERDRLFPASIGSWGNAGAVLPIGGGGGGGNLRDHRGALIATTARQAGEPGLNVNKPRILKSGNLRKATARSVGRLEKTTWKTKYVELTPGSFAYSDSGPSVLGKSRSAKVIPLHQGFCTCRTVKAKHRVTRSRNSVILSNLPKPANHLHTRGRRGMSGSGIGQMDESGFGGGGGSSSKHLLEIEVVGLKRRQWAAESKQECRRWVSAIKGAMTERPVDPDETALGEDQLPIIPHDSCHRHHMESYLSARGFLRNATSTEDYLSALKGLMAVVGTGTGTEPESRQGGQQETCAGMGMGVPVKWVKQQLPGSERVYQTSARGRGKSELAQLWKDMKRDTVSINGRVMTGEQGPEGIIGALTRCILAQAGRLSSSDSLSKLSEAQSLLAARDVLLACDRTTSGGDTYLVVDNLCRNPPLVVLVPASQEAEPLDITVTLHPRAAQGQPHSRAATPTPPPPSRPNEKGGETRTNGSSPRYPPSPGGPLAPPSPSSVGTNSAAASPACRGPQAGRPGSAAACPGAARESRGGEGGPPETQQQQQQLASKGLASTAPEVVLERYGVKRREAFKTTPRGGKAGSPRSGSSTPPAVVARHAKNWDVPQVVDLEPAASPRPGAGRASITPGPGDKRREGEGEAMASPTGERGRETGVFGPTPTRGAGDGGGGGGGGGSGSGRIFASLSQRRSGEAAAGRSGGNGLRTKPRDAPPALSAREKGAGDKGRKAGVVRGGLSSAPADTQASYKMFFGDTDDGGEESGSSDDDEDGLRPRKSFITVSCTARTSYKLFSSDPQDEERDVFAVVTGLFEQSFTISREFPSGSGSRAGTGSATRTEGSVAFLTFNKPVVKRRSLDSQTSEGSKATVVDAEPKERAEPADAEVADGASPLPPGNNGGGNGNTVRIDPFDADSDDSSFDLFDGNGPGSQTFPCNWGGSVLEGQEEEEGEGENESGACQNEEAPGAKAGYSKNVNTNIIPPRAHHTDDGVGGGHNRRPEPAARTLLGEEAEAEPEPEPEGAPGTKGYGCGFARKSGDGGGIAADGELANFAATAALTPDSVGPVPFSSGSTAPRSRAGSSEPPISPAPSPSLPSSVARVERKVSRIKGLLRRFSSRDMSDRADALQIQPLEIDSDDEFGA